MIFTIWTYLEYKLCPHHSSNIFQLNSVSFTECKEILQTSLHTTLPQDFPT